MTNTERFLLIVQTVALSMEVQEKKQIAGLCVSAAMETRFTRHCRHDALFDPEFVYAVANEFCDWFYDLEIPEDWRKEFEGAQFNELRLPTGDAVRVAARKKTPAKQRRKRL